MEKLPRHRPYRHFENQQRLLIDCELSMCPHYGAELKPRHSQHMRKNVQTLKDPVWVTGKSKKCVNPQCPHTGENYYASGVCLISLPFSTYGLDMLAYIGWWHEHEHKQMGEIQSELNGRGVLVNNRNVGKLYRQFLALLGALQEPTKRKLEATVSQHGGLIWAMDALQLEGCGSLLYVLYEALSSTPVAAIQVEHLTAAELAAWLKPYQELAYPVLATHSDGEDTIAAAFQSCWPGAPHQLCQVHFLGNLAEDVLKEDDQLRQNLRNELGGLPAVPKQPAGEDKAPLF